MYAPLAQLVSGNFVHSADFLKLAMNPGGGSGRDVLRRLGRPWTCSANTSTVLGVNSYVTNVNCSGVGYSSRVDIPEVLQWIQEYLP